MRKLMFAALALMLSLPGMLALQAGPDLSKSE
jgi:hypothetical protein